MAKHVKLPKVSKDPYARTSYLFQVASFHTAQKNHIMARSMARTVDLVSKRTVLKLSPHLKRLMCKKCSSVLVPGLTMSVEIENSSKSSAKADVLVHTCLTCQKQKRFPIGKDREYELFCDKKDVLV
ncbi:putative ribonuclease P subunit [Clavispora lusitaniae]|uniref:Uncharacterized protein n=3 Tax=Clavispora lusitaniae TaxID=36911 RepID=C4YBJ7_CLAL4|nr:uncharacterized protein CLUG_05575 [Clavispora lusitaniae ATCC 42720]KAF5209044.1 hypothetical protein E0198_004958 [Clavispora lusitaniae]EEQ41447.1 hypothetical protein CLUG_05575 [Clavispora lusitaniae ATCC 42720]KAF7581068.1 RNAse P Rpr2/Rpp21/SNM1 subunit domain family protein [Clavispora lusitaniae]OVF04839.1 putative ribonuclease P protein subunit [Clavispora lusitaniae]QFZ29957.1 putative ribonuclease P subunit [Clavispora lusitaniae]